MALRPPQLIGESALFLALLDRVSDLAALNRPVLIAGERGTGKEIIASRMHFLSPRWEQTYIRVNCAAFKGDGLEAELFGTEQENGAVNLADGGTLFLDNIDAASPWMQEKLLTLVETGEFSAADTIEIQQSDIHFIAAAAPTKDLREVVKAGKFSAELLDRLTSHVLTLPPLRIRPEDIAPLVTYFGKAAVSNLGAERFPGITPEALMFLQEQPWPGNVRELKNVVERSTAESYLRDENLTDPIHDIIMDPFANAWLEEVSAAGLGQSEPQNPAPSALSGTAAAPNTPLETTDFTTRVLAFEKNLIDQALAKFEHHQGHAAEYMGLSYHQFRGLLRKHGMKK